jgi:hypothetical protein
MALKILNLQGFEIFCALKATACGAISTEYNLHSHQTGVDSSDESSPGRLWIQVAPEVSYNEPFLQDHGLAMVCPDFERII